MTSPDAACGRSRPFLFRAAALAATSLALVFTPSGTAASGYRSDRILVQPKAGADEAVLSALHSINKARVLGAGRTGGGLQVLSLPPRTDVPALIAKYRRSALVEFAEFDYIRHGAVTTPNDPKYLDGTLWGLHNYGQNGGTSDADIDAPEAWDFVTSASGIVVAVLDSGIRYTHEDLAANMWTNPVDGSHGWNALTSTSDPSDPSGHGTLSAGVLGAAGNNGKGVVGVAWGVQMMACACFDANNDGSDSDIIACLDYARTNGARIVNASWGSYSNSLALSNAIFRLRQEGVIFVAAAGNDVRDIDVMPYYPASFDIDNIVSVAYTTANDTLGRLSNFGATNVDLAAPGAAMYSTFFTADNAYLGSPYLEGTSFSAPMVSGALALLSSRHPAETHVQIIGRLLRAADPLPALAGKCATAGRLNLHRALNPPLLLSATPSEGTIRLRVTSEPGTLVVVEAASDLARWDAVHTNTTSATGSFEYAEPLMAQPLARFYRAVAKRRQLN